MLSIVFKKYYIGSLFEIKQESTKYLGFKLFLFIDDELICELDTDEVINYNIYCEINFYIKDLYTDETIKEFCNDVNDFVRQWQW